MLRRDDSDQQWEDNFATNVFGSVKTTRAILPHFRSRKSGTIAYIGSLSGRGGGAGTSTYCSTKAAVAMVAESVAMEVSSFGIQSLCFEPGTFRTELLSGKNLSAAPDSTIKDYGTVLKDTKDLFAGLSGNQIGDVEKGIPLMLSLIKRTRSGEKLPVRIPIGDDSFSYATARGKSTVESLNPLSKELTSTNIDGVETPDISMLGMYVEA
jgi:NAD(P)-dependent dehydrogenase (short-subunit alcohol dehydrogenase family)